MVSEVDRKELGRMCEEGIVRWSLYVRLEGWIIAALPDPARCIFVRLYAFGRVQCSMTCSQRCDFLTVNNLITLEIISYG
jgi:hypothetical protein